MACQTCGLFHQRDALIVPLTANLECAGALPLDDDFAARPVLDALGGRRQSASGLICAISGLLCHRIRCGDCWRDGPLDGLRSI
jgi:hypothetical protein